MKLKNYSSTAPVENSIFRIESKLAAAGAIGITKMYNDQKECCALYFEWKLLDRSYPIRLPVKTDSCFQVMWKEYRLQHRAVRPGSEKNIRAQAHRTAWKIAQEWIEIQISLTVMGQAEFLEVFLPYVVWNGNQTVFESFKAGAFKQLPEYSSAQTT